MVRRGTPRRFALAVNGANPPFAEIASTTLRVVLSDRTAEAGSLTERRLVLTGLGDLRLHRGKAFVPGVNRLLRRVRLVTLIRRNLDRRRTR